MNARRPSDDRRLSVAVIRARYNPAGGAERFVQRALSALSGRSMALTIVAREWRGGSRDEGLPADVRLARVDPFYIGNVWRDYSFARAVRRHLADARYGLVQSHERIPGVMLYRAGDGVHAEFLAQRHRVLSPRARLGVRLNPYHAYMVRAERRMFTHPALRAVICNSEMVRDEIASRFGVDRSRLVLIRNGVDLDRYCPADEATRARERHRLGLPDDAPVFVFVGSGFERKGLAAALRSMARSEAPAGARLLVAGSDRRIGRYRALAAQLGLGSRVSFLGVVEDVRTVLAAADALLMPTLYDPFPNAVLEALACGIPAITSTKSGAAEVIEEGVSGFVADALDLPALARAQTRIAEARGTPVAVSMRGAARGAARRHSLASLGDDLVALYDRLLAEQAAEAGSPAGPSPDTLSNG